MGKENVYRDQHKSHIEASDEKTTSENCDIEDRAETACETGDDLAVVKIWHGFFLKANFLATIATGSNVHQRRS